MHENLIVAQNVEKAYGKFKALDQFSCEFSAGITGLLGPNGAGKTTFIRCLLGILPFNKGQICFFDYELPRDIATVKNLIGYSPEVATIMLKTTATRYVTHFARISGLPREAALQRAFDTLHYVGLEEARYRDMDTFSAGMLQRVKLAAALVHDPLLLVLDEPTSGMDPPGREKMLNLIKDLGKNHGKHIILSTHLLPDIEKTSDSVVIISHGKRLTQGSLSSILTRKSSQKSYIIRVSGSTKEFADLIYNAGIDVSDVQGHIKCQIDSNDESRLISLFQIAKKNGFVIRSLTQHRQRLEDVFLDLIDHSEEVAES